MDNVVQDGNKLDARDNFLVNEFFQSKLRGESIKDLTSRLHISNTTYYEKMRNPEFKKVYQELQKEEFGFSVEDNLDVIRQNVIANATKSGASEKAIEQFMKLMGVDSLLQERKDSKDEWLKDAYRMNPLFEVSMLLADADYKQAIKNGDTTRTADLINSLVTLGLEFYCAINKLDSSEFYTTKNVIDEYARAVVKDDSCTAIEGDEIDALIEEIEKKLENG
ncbi:hypothetical protein [Arthrobacter sp. NPDC057013]|uniref:hypothetical protein n=1 Tax=Arthrobacter sp. NPDC057013 TaxID=3345999 RepID=UPI003636E003